MVLDTSVLFAILTAEDDAESLLRIAMSANSLLLSTASLVELGTLMVRRFPSDGLERTWHLLALLNVAVIALDRAQAERAIDAYRRFGKGSKSPARLNLGDSYAYGLAAAKGLPLLFKGDDFTHTDIRPAL